MNECTNVVLCGLRLTEVLQGIGMISSTNELNPYSNDLDDLPLKCRPVLVTSRSFVERNLGE